MRISRIQIDHLSSQSNYKLSGCLVVWSERWFEKNWCLVMVKKLKILCRSHMKKHSHQRFTRSKYQLLFKPSDRKNQCFVHKNAQPQKNYCWKFNSKLNPHNIFTLCSSLHLTTSVPPVPYFSFSANYKSQHEKKKMRKELPEQVLVLIRMIKQLISHFQIPSFLATA